jgi:hypothetical protein
MAMVLLTCLLVVQPESVFKNVSDQARQAYLYAGMISLCLTFCWSVIFGIVLTINNLLLRG